MKRLVFILSFVLPVAIYGASKVVVFDTSTKETVPTDLKLRADTVSISDEVYDAANWDADLTAPTKNAVRDKIETIGSGGGANWEAEGLSDSRLEGTAYVGTLVATDGVSVPGSGSPGYFVLYDADGVGHVRLNPASTTTTDINVIFPASPSTGLWGGTVSGATNFTLSAVTTVSSLEGFLGSADILTADEIDTEAEFEALLFTLPEGGAGTLPTTSLGDMIIHNGTTDIRMTPSTVFRFTEDFVHASAGNLHPWSVSGSGSISLSDPEQGRPGILYIDTATSTVSKLLNLSTLMIVAGGGEIWFETSVKIADLSDAAEEYDVRIGFGDSSSSDHTDGIFFKYDRNTSVNWQTVTSSGSVRTTTDSGIAVSTSWVRLAFRVNAGGTSVSFFVNGVDTGTAHTANIPTTTYSGPSFQIVASAGSTAEVRRLYVDYMDVLQIFTTAR